MCGIVGYTGGRQAADILLEGLGRLEYRGYDSAGMAVVDEKGAVKLVKAMGKIHNLIERTEHGKTLSGHCGIGHTRWATHGEPNEMNAHPHISGDFHEEISDYSTSDVIGVHNGIIENYEELRDKLLRHGYEFYSDTDTEVAIKTVDYYYRKYKIGPIDAINRMMVRVRGSYALALMFRDYPGEIYAARKDSPLIIGISGEESFLASDVTAMLNYTRTVYYIGNLQAARLKPGEAHFYDLNGDEILIPQTEVTWDAADVGKNGYQHFMMKEIHEQPQAVRNTMDSVIKKDEIDFSGAGITDDVLRQTESVCMVACGSAWHVGMTAQYVMEDLAQIPVRVELASEYRYRRILPTENALVIVISQSGERPEIAVATTKAFSSQLMLIYLLAVRLAYVKGRIGQDLYYSCIRELKSLPDKIERLLMGQERIQWFASKYANAKDAFFIGRGADYAISLEGSLKLKEITYIHSEAYAAGELKHGTISLIEKRTPVIGVLTQKKLLEKTVSNMKECKARGAYLIAVTDLENELIDGSMDFVIRIPETDEHFSGILAVVPLQLLGYYISVSKGLDVDKPRNLAKSVTVE